MSILGTRVVRTEDPRLLTAGGTYVDDLRVPELTDAARVTFVRSPMAHAKITGMDTDAARQAPGVLAVLTIQDMDDLVPPPPPEPGSEVSEGAPMPLGGVWSEPLLAVDRVRYVGEPVAMVITSDSYQGEDAAELVSVDYEPLPAVIGVAGALQTGTLLFDATDSNMPVNSGDDADDAIFEGCDAVVERTIVNQRLAPMPMEGRAAAARFADGKLTYWVSTQNAQISRFILAGALGMDPATIRVITPDVGGGFGAKVGIDRDAILVAWAARKTGRALRWVETRSENLVGMTHGRAQEQTIKLGGTKDGRVLAYRLDVVQDTGAYPRMSGFLPFLTKLMAVGPYDIPRVQTHSRVVVTNTTPISAYRGAGRPEATAAVERAVDLFAAEIGMDPAEVRRKNLIPPDKFPYSTPTGATYDTGDYVTALDKVLAAAGYAELRAEQQRRRERGDVLQLGIGLASYVEITAADAAAGETARLTVHGDGTATVYTGSSAHGQGHHTAWAMLVEAELGIPMPNVTVIHGDTDLIPEGIGTYGSRSLQLGGVAVHKAALDVKEQARRVAADMLEAAEADLELDAGSGTWQVRGDPGTGRTWADVATHAGEDGLRGLRPVRRGRRDVPVRQPRGRCRGRHRDRQGAADPARDRGRRRDRGQPGAGRGAAARRHRPGCGAGAARGDDLRRRRQPAHRHARRLRRDHRGGAAELRAGAERDADGHQPARGQGNRRGRDDRRHPGRPERGRRRGQPPRRPAHRHADHAVSGLGRDQRGDAERRDGETQ